MRESLLSPWIKSGYRVSPPFCANFLLRVDMQNTPLLIMLRAVLVLFAKRKPPPAPQRHKIARRLGRRTGSLSGRHLTAPRRVEGTPEAEVNPAPPQPGGVALVQVSSEEVFSRAPQSCEANASKPPSYRLATAVSTVVVPPVANVYLQGMKQTLTPAAQRPPGGDVRPGLGQVQYMEEYYTSRKGPLFATAVIAGTNAVKQASTLIPFCHPIPIQKCSFTFRRRVVGGGLNYSALPHRVVLRKRAVQPPPPQPSKQECSVLYCFCTVATEEVKTGVEMEALTGATVAGLTLYDMLKGLPGAQEDGLAIGEAFILAKRGGRSDFTKLLMSEPNKPTQATVAPPANAATNVPSSSTVDDKKGQSNADAGEEESKETSEAAKDEKSEEEADEEEDVTEEEEEEQEQETKVERKPIMSPLKKVAGSSTSAVCARPAGDAGAWWRSSRHEKKLQELYPRRKYGEGSRVSPPEKVLQKNHTPAPVKNMKGKSATTLKPAAHREVEDEDPEPNDDDDYAADSEAEDVDETPAPSGMQRKHRRTGQLTKKSGRAIVRDAPPSILALPSSKSTKKSVPVAAGRLAGKTATQADKKTLRATLPPSPADDEEEEEEDEEQERDDEYEENDAAEEEEEEAEPDEEEVTMVSLKKSPARQKTKRVRTIAAPSDDEGDEDVKAKPLVKGGSSKKLAMREVQHDSWDPERLTYEDEVADDDGEEEEPPLPLKKFKKRRR